MTDADRLEKLEKLARVLQRRITQIQHENNTLQAIVAEQGAVMTAMWERMVCVAKKKS